MGGMDWICLTQDRDGNGLGFHKMHEFFLAS